MSFNDILVETGGFGLYQKFLTFGCLQLSLLVVSFTYWNQVFILLIPPHRCKVFPNDTEWITNINETDAQEIGKCHINYENGTSTDCKYGMVYDFSLNYPTYASEHDLVCENAWKVYVTHTAFWTGKIFGTIVFGILNDKYGRRRAFQGAIILTLLADVSTYFCDQHIPFMITRFLSAAGDGNIASSAFVLVIEHSLPEKRRITIFAWSFICSLASAGITWLVYVLGSWRYILMVTWIPTMAAIIMSLFLPESPSWLITKGRIDDAIVYIQRMAKVNGKPISKERILCLLELNVESKEKDHNDIKTISCNTEKSGLEYKKSTLSVYRAIVAVVKSPNLRKRILCLGFIWMASCACYNGNNLEFSNLPFNMYITYSIGGLIEIPGNLFTVFTLDKFGRRWTNAGFFIVGGICGIVSACVVSESLILVLVMAMRTCYASAFDITFSISSELLPTVIRGRALSAVRICGGLGSAAAPSVVSLAQNDPLLPLALFGVTAVIAGLLMLTMPETTHYQLPQTIEEAENFGKDQSFWLCPYTRGHPEKQNDDLHENHLSETLTNPAFETDDEQVKCVRIQKLPKY